MTITAKLILKSANPYGGPDLVTLELRYPRFILAELNTHRAFSKSSASSRAIPVAKLIQSVLDDPAMPIRFGRNQKGMRAPDELSHVESELARKVWIEGRDRAVEQARKMIDYNVAKEISNRLIESYAHVSTLITATDWDNFFELRLHPDAQPEIHELARVMKIAIDSAPAVSREWHIPYLKWIDDGNPVDTLLKVSTARCARVSYLGNDGKVPTIEKDLDLYERLVGARPLHASPAEHQAQAVKRGRFRNFDRWIQHRHFLEKGAVNYA